MKIDMTKVNVKSVINEEALEMNNFRMPFLEGVVMTAGAWNIEFQMGKAVGNFLQVVKFNLQKKFEEKPFAEGAFAYNVSTGEILEDSVAVTLHEKFLGTKGMRKLAKRSGDIMRMIKDLVATFAFINAVEERNLSNTVVVEGEARKRQAAGDVGYFDAESDSDAERVYVPMIKHRIKTVSKEGPNTPKRDFVRKTDQWTVRGYWARRGGRTVWVRPHTKSWS